jgi:hypothetical protein
MLDFFNKNWTVEMQKPPYKTANNRWWTKSLFWDLVRDTCYSERTSEFEPIFTLYHDNPKYINARKTFVAMGDPTGYKWAMQYLADYDHWRALLKHSWFREAYESWCEELNAKLASEGIEAVRRVAKSENDSQALAAGKWLATKEWDKKPRGRPSKADVVAATKEEVKKRTVEDDDMARIGLVVNNGNRSPA